MTKKLNQEQQLNKHDVSKSLWIFKIKSNMKVTSSKPKGQRILKCLKVEHKNHRGKIIKHKRPFWIEPLGKNWWFDLEKGQWYENYDSNRRSTTSYYAMTYDGFKDVYSLKAVKRLIAKWDVPKGTKFRASLPFVGYDLFITKT